MWFPKYILLLPIFHFESISLTCGKRQFSFSIVVVVLVPFSSDPICPIEWLSKPISTSCILPRLLELGFINWNEMGNLSGSRWIHILVCELWIIKLHIIGQHYCLLLLFCCSQTVPMHTFWRKKNLHYILKKLHSSRRYHYILPAIKTKTRNISTSFGMNLHVLVLMKNV